MNSEVEREIEGKLKVLLAVGEFVAQELRDCEDMRKAHADNPLVMRVWVLPQEQNLLLLKALHDCVLRRRDDKIPFGTVLDVALRYMEPKLQEVDAARQRLKRIQAQAA